LSPCNVYPEQFLTEYQAFFLIILKKLFVVSACYYSTYAKPLKNTKKNTLFPTILILFPPSFVLVNAENLTHLTNSVQKPSNFYRVYLEFKFGDLE